MSLTHTPRLLPGAYPSHIFSFTEMFMSQHWVSFLFKVAFFSNLVITKRWSIPHLRFTLPEICCSRNILAGWSSVGKTFSYFALTDPTVLSETALGLVHTVCVTDRWGFTHDWSLDEKERSVFTHIYCTDANLTGTRVITWSFLAILGKKHKPLTINQPQLLNLCAGMKWMEVMKKSKSKCLVFISTNVPEVY